MIELRAVIVCVDYYDYLKLTLPWNQHHFKEMMIVTSREDLKTLEVGLSFGARVFRTDSFYDDGAEFNKWKALEEGLDRFGRYGWICLMDADVCWPQIVSDHILRSGNIYSPYRRMCPHTKKIPEESSWKKYPRHRYSRPHELSGYTQIFHAEDPNLGNPPWHEINWRHAGGADTFFQAKWPAQNRIRPDWEVLHLGVAGQWTGRTEQFLDGTYPKNIKTKTEKLKQYLSERRRTKKYDHEKLT